MKKWGHDELLADLAEHLVRPERMMWLDMPMEDSGSCRPDAFTINKSFTNPKPIAYEIKVSISDFRSDITSGKWQKYLNYAGAVIFCVPKGMITKADIPNGCGLMVRGDESWRTMKAPTIQKMPDLPVKTWLKLLMSGVEQEYKVAREKRADSFHSYTSAKKHFSEDVYLVISGIENARNHIKYLESKYKTLEINHKARSERHREKMIEDIKSDRDSLDRVLKEFSDLFGFSVKNSWNIRQSLEAIKNRCDEGHEVARLRKVIIDMRTTLDIHLHGALPDIKIKP